MIEQNSLSFDNYSVENWIGYGIPDPALKKWVSKLNLEMPLLKVSSLIVETDVDAAAPVGARDPVLVPGFALVVVPDLGQ